MLNTLLPLLSFGLLYLLLRRLPHLLAVTRSRSFLPSHRLTRPAHSDKPGWNLERNGLTTSVWTSALNGLPRAVIGRLRPSAQEKAKRIYDAGAALGVLGAVLGGGGAVWAWLGVWRKVFDEASEHVGRGEGQRVVRRALDALAAYRSPSSASAGGLLQPLIPGITAPFDHLLTMSLALLLNQLVHETGHAISAALDNIDPTRLSFNLHVVLPSATVSFPSSVDYLGGRAKVRLAAAGAWHNLITFGIIYLAGICGGSSLFWREAGYQGQTVYSVDPRSALAGHVNPGTLFVHLDDVPLGGLASSWQDYLSGSLIGDQGKGWCLSRSALVAVHDPPCEPGTLSFERADAASGTGRIQHCLNPRPILDEPSTNCRCGTEEICLRPALSEHVLRMGVAKGSKTEVILFAGERAEVLDAVTVGTRKPRLWAGGTFWASLLLSYLSNVALSLFFFNLLPLPATDGSAIVRALLSLISTESTFTLINPRPIRASLMGRSRGHTPTITTPTITLYREYELDSDDEGGAEEGAVRRENTGRREEVWQRRLRRIIEGVMTALVIGWAAGWLMLALLRSS